MPVKFSVPMPLPGDTTALLRFTGPPRLPLPPTDPPLVKVTALTMLPVTTSELPSTVVGPV